MALITLEEVMKIHDGAVGAFSTYDLFTAQGIISAAEETGRPVIAMIGAPILNRPGNEYIGEIMVTLAKRSSAKVCVFLDHAKDYASCLKAIRLGFSSVMIDGSYLSVEENIELTRKVAESAHSLGISVEAEIGALAGLEDGENVKTAKMAKPEHVAQFLNGVKVEALAVSIGNAHGLYKGEPNLNFDLLQKINQIAAIPLVLHGGTGLTKKQFATGIKFGMKKINIGTEVRRTYIEAFYNAHQIDVDSWDMAAMTQAGKNAVNVMVKDNLNFFAEKWRDLC